LANAVLAVVETQATLMAVAVPAAVVVAVAVAEETTNTTGEPATKRKRTKSIIPKMRHAPDSALAG